MSRARLRWRTCAANVFVMSSVYRERAVLAYGRLKASHRSFLSAQRGCFDGFLLKTWAQRVTARATRCTTAAHRNPVEALLCEPSPAIHRAQHTAQ